MEKQVQKPRRYKIKIPLNQTKFLDYNSGIAQDKIFYFPPSKGHILLMHGKYIIDIPKGLLIFIGQN